MCDLSQEEEDRCSEQRLLGGGRTQTTVQLISTAPPHPRLGLHWAVSSLGSPEQAPSGESQAPPPCAAHLQGHHLYLQSARKAQCGRTAKAQLWEGAAQVVTRLYPGCHQVVHWSPGLHPMSRSLSWGQWLQRTLAGTQLGSGPSAQATLTLLCGALVWHRFPPGPAGH